jgi:hypothetical protein
MRFQNILRARIEQRFSWIIRLSHQLTAGLEGARLQPCRYVCVERWASAPEGASTSIQHRGPSVAKAIMMTAAYGAAEAVPLQNMRTSQGMRSSQGMRTCIDAGLKVGSTEAT